MTDGRGGGVGRKREKGRGKEKGEGGSRPLSTIIGHASVVWPVKRRNARLKESG